MSFGDDTLSPTNIKETQARTTESEIERRLTSLRSLPILRENGWLPYASCQWLTSGVKMITFTIFVGRYSAVVASASRDSTDAQEAIDKVFTHITKKLEELKARADEEQRRTKREEG